jgi:hypothetical protein
MPFIVLDHTAPQRAEPQRLKQDLRKALETALNIQRQAAEMDDAQVQAQFGVPAGAVSAFRTNVDDIVTALQSQAVTNIISSMGFSA